MLALQSPETFAHLFDFAFAFASVGAGFGFAFEAAFDAPCEQVARQLAH